MENQVTVIIYSFRPPATLPDAFVITLISLAITSAHAGGFVSCQP